jgi:hypothetical protein
MEHRADLDHDKQKESTDYVNGLEKSDSSTDDFEFEG